MTSCEALQAAERMFLRRHFKKDTAFKKVSQNTFQYRYGEKNDNHSFLLEIQWVENYPEVGPVINVDVPYNDHLSADKKGRIASFAMKRSDLYVGGPMTFAVFEDVREKAASLLEGERKEEADEIELPESDGEETDALYKELSSIKDNPSQWWLDFIRDIDIDVQKRRPPGTVATREQGGTVHGKVRSVKEGKEEEMNISGKELDGEEEEVEVEEEEEEEEEKEDEEDYDDNIDDDDDDDDYDYDGNDDAEDNDNDKVKEEKIEAKA